MIDQKAPLILTAEEKDSRLWRKLVDHFDARISSIRIQNDGDKNDIETAKLRGRIAELKSIVSIGKDAPLIAENY